MIYNFLLLFFSFLFPTVLGAGILYFIRYNRQSFQSSFIQYLIVSFALGFGLITFLMFWWGILSLPAYYFMFLIAFLVIILLVFFVFIALKKYRQNLTTAKFLLFLKIGFKQLSSLSFFEWFLILIIIFEIIFVFSEAGLRPITAFAFDALATWAWKAKVCFYQFQDFFSPSSEFFLSAGGHQNYPLHLPLSMAWIYFWLGRVDDVAVNFIFAFYFLGLLGLAYSNLRSCAGRRISLIFTAFLATMPLFAYHGFQAYADLSLTFYFTLAVILIFQYIRRFCLFGGDSENKLVVPGLIIGLMTWVKNEGLMLAGVIFISFLLSIFVDGLLKKVGSLKRNQVFKSFLSGEIPKKRRFGQLGIFILSFALVFLPWLIFKICHHLSYSNLTNDQKMEFFRVFHPETFSAVLNQIFLSHSFHLWPGIFIILLFIGLIAGGKKMFGLEARSQDGQGIIFLILTVLGVIVAYSLLYVFTLSYQFALDGTIVSRNFLVLAPLSIFLAGIVFPNANGRDKK